MKLSSTWFASILIASALLLSAASGGGDENHQSQTNRNERSRTHKTKQPTPAFTIIVQPAPVQIVQQASAVKEKQPAQKWYQRPTITDWGIFGVTIAYTLISLGLLNATRIQAKLANNALIETQKAANAAMKNADAAIATAAAYVYEMPIWIEGYEKGGDIMDGGVGFVEPVVHYGFENFGKSPAYVSEICWQKFVGLRLPPIPVYGNVSDNLENLLVIGAEKDTKVGYKWSHLFGTYLAEEEIEPVRKMEQRLYIYGYFRYRDVFGRRTIVGYAYRIDAKGNPSLVSPEEAVAYVYRRLE